MKNDVNTWIFEHFIMIMIMLCEHKCKMKYTEWQRSRVFLPIFVSLLFMDFIENLAQYQCVYTQTHTQYHNGRKFQYYLALEFIANEHRKFMYAENTLKWIPKVSWNMINETLRSISIRYIPTRILNELKLRIYMLLVLANFMAIV